MKATYDNLSTRKMVVAKDYNAPNIVFEIVPSKVFCLTDAPGHAGRGNTALCQILKKGILFLKF